MDIEAINNANQERGRGGTMYADYLNNAQNEFISSTGQFAHNEDNSANNGSTEEGSNSIRPLYVMQGNREEGSGGRSEAYEGYDPSGPSVLMNNKKHTNKASMKSDFYTDNN